MRSKKQKNECISDQFQLKINIENFEIQFNRCQHFHLNECIEQRFQSEKNKN